jgi:DNA repair protein RadC
MYQPKDTRSNVELISDLLGRPIDNSVIQLARDLDDPSLTGFSWNEVVKETEKIGPRTIARLEAAAELGRRIYVNKVENTHKYINDAESVYEQMAPIIERLPNETFYSLSLNTKNKLLRKTEVSVGTLSSTIVHARDVFREAIKQSAASVILVHNHPSGDPTPSNADINLTKQITSAGEILGIKVLDHVIIGEKCWESMTTLGFI